MSDKTGQTGGVNIGGSVGSVGGDIVGRDIINNITVHSLNQVEDLATLLKASMAQLGSIPEPDALDSLSVVLDEIAKLYLLIDTEVTRYLSLSFDDPQQMFPDRAVLLSLDGGQIKARAAEARGHCEKIFRIYSNRLRPWFQARLSSNAMDRVEQAFGGLAISDAGMWYSIDELAKWLSQKASQTSQPGGCGGRNRRAPNCEGRTSRLPRDASKAGRHNQRDATYSGRIATHSALTAVFWDTNSSRSSPKHPKGPISVPTCTPMAVIRDATCTGLERLPRGHILSSQAPCPAKSRYWIGAMSKATRAPPLCPWSARMASYVALPRSRNRR